MKFNLSTLANKYPYPKEFRTESVDTSAVMTGYFYEELFHGIEIQQELILDKYKGRF